MAIREKNVTFSAQPETIAPMGEPPLTCLQYIVLSVVVSSPNPMCGRDICRSIFGCEGLPYPPIYRALNSLERSGFVKKFATVKLKSAPPIKPYVATGDGWDALMATRDHYQALVQLVASL